MKKILPFFITIITMCCLHLAVFEAKAIEKDWTFDPKTSTLIPKYLGKVKVLNGKAVIGERELKKGSKIYNDELVQTSQKSFLVIEMIDLTTITIGPKSEFKVENWAYRTKNDRDAVFSIGKGQWRALIKSKSKDDDQLKIKTPLVSLGVRGTELLVNVNKVADKEVDQVALLEGHIHLNGDLPVNIKKDMVAGDYAIIEKNEKGITQQQKILSPEEMKAYQQFIAPEVLRLMDPVALTPNQSAQTNINQTQRNNDQVSAATSIDSNTERTHPKAQSKSLKEKLEILNSTREKNLKFHAN